MALTMLTEKDRCDRCGARACARTHHGDHYLLWCAHHYRQHQDVLAPDLVYYATWWESESKESVKA